MWPFKSNKAIEETSTEDRRFFLSELREINREFEQKRFAKDEEEVSDFINVIMESFEDKAREAASRGFNYMYFDKTQRHHFTIKQTEKLRGILNQKLAIRYGPGTFLTTLEHDSNYVKIEW